MVTALFLFLLILKFFLYIKRLIGLPGDKIQIIDSKIYVNGENIFKKQKMGYYQDENNPNVSIELFEEKIINQNQKSSSIKEKKINIIEQKISPQDNTPIYQVPENYYFFMGDNRDNSEDSRFLNEVGYIPRDNIVGQAKLVFFSLKKPIWTIFNEADSIRKERFFKIIQ